MTPARLARYEATLAGPGAKGAARGRWCRGHGADFTLERLSRPRRFDAPGRRRSHAAHRARCARSAPAARACCAATTRSTRRWKRRRPPFSAPSASCISAAAMPPTWLFFPPCRSAAISSCTTRWSMPARMRACGRAGRRRSPAAHNDVEAFEEAIGRWRADGGNGRDPGSRSKASIRWMATARRSPSLPHLPNGTTAFW